ncbi:MAG: hypothetical protein GF353_16470, partial [Candidatus Lokiarchaeota archaeon]|nr:hypothetical protein [Candidatus Lokiarchaeota archaeon]
MSDSYDYFMVYELNDSGERQRLNITEDYFREDNGQNILHPEQVVVIVKEDIRRIFIWKGSKSHVRKRFISSRVASALQEELVKEAAFHRCKIVSVDQGDEPREFLRTFNFKSMEVKEKLADMRYIRNVEREKMYDRGEIPDTSPKIVKVDKKKKESISPALKNLKKSAVAEKTTSTPTPKMQPETQSTTKKAKSISSRPNISTSSSSKTSPPKNVV